MPEAEPAKSDQAKPKWTETFGNTLCILSTSLGIPPEEVALLVASVMGNLSGPAAGLVGASSRRIAPGFNLLAIGAPDHRLRRILDQVLAPAIGMQETQRDFARRSHPYFTDLQCFGPADIKDIEHLMRGRLRDRCVDMLRAVERDLELGDAIAANWDVPVAPNLPHLWGEREDRLLNERLPGPRHRPSFLFCTSDVSRLDEMLAETMDQHVFLVDRSSGFFRGSFLTRVCIEAGTQRYRLVIPAGSALDGTREGSAP